MVDQIRKAAEQLIALQPHPSPRLRLLRDVLGVPADDQALLATREEVAESRAVKDLENFQFADGTWGRFHSQDSKVILPFRTTEFAIRRALALGLTRYDPILEKASAFMEKFLEGNATWLDPPEKHEGWPVNTRVITAGTLSEVDPFHPLLPSFHSRWVEILTRTFHAGEYDPVAERNAQFDLNGIFTRGKYMHLGMLYPLLIIASGSTPLPMELETCLLQWLWHRPEGIYYVCPGPLDNFPEQGSPRFSTWLEGLKLLACFPQAGGLLQPAVDWIWKQRDPQGFWDFRPHSAALPFFPLSNNWRNSINRRIDCSVDVLFLLRNLDLKRGRDD